MTRRRLLQLLVGVAGTVLTLILLWRPQRLARLVSLRFKPRLDATAPGVLSKREMETIVAFAAVLVEGRELDAQEASYVVEHVTDKAGRTPGYLALYRKTAGCPAVVGVVGERNRAHLSPILSERAGQVKPEPRQPRSSGPAPSQAGPEREDRRPDQAAWG